MAIKASTVVYERTWIGGWFLPAEYQTAEAADLDLGDQVVRVSSGEMSSTSWTRWTQSYTVVRYAALGRLTARARLRTMFEAMALGAKVELVSAYPPLDSGRCVGFPNSR